MLPANPTGETELTDADLAFVFGSGGEDGEVEGNSSKLRGAGNGNATGDDSINGIGSANNNSINAEY